MQTFQDVDIFTTLSFSVLSFLILGFEDYFNGN